MTTLFNKDYKNHAAQSTLISLRISKDIWDAAKVILEKLAKRYLAAV